MKTKCECEGFEDRFSHSTGHYTVTVHEEGCANSPANREEREMERADYERDRDIDDDLTDPIDPNEGIDARWSTW